MPPDEPTAGDTPPQTEIVTARVVAGAEARDAEADAAALAISDKDARNLNLLALLHYVLGVVTALGALPLLPLWSVGQELMDHPVSGEPLSESASLFVELCNAFSSVPLQPLDYPVAGAVILFTVGGAVTLGLAHGAVLAYLGRCLARRRRRMLCVIVSALNLTNLPLGTVLSLCTLVVLMRPGVKGAFRTVREAKGPGGESAAKTEEGTTEARRHGDEEYHEGHEDREG